eukprot:COSAG04_NODE_1363_length_7079_cov_19.484815_5_plen_83_part_00
MLQLTSNCVTTNLQLRYADQVKNPRGPISPKRQHNGLVLMTYYNDGGFGAFATHMAVNDRNCMWLTAGHEQVRCPQQRSAAA